jgi:hypothetical protein
LPKTEPEKKYNRSAANNNNMGGLVGAMNEQTLVKDERERGVETAIPEALLLRVLAGYSFF